MGHLYLTRLFKGRINRRNYLFGNLLLFISGLVLYLVIAVVLVFQNGVITPMQVIGVLLFCGLLIVYALSFQIRRMHDLGLSGWYVFLKYWVDYWFVEGEGKENKYGKSPRPMINVKSLLALEACMKELSQGKLANP